MGELVGLSKFKESYLRQYSRIKWNKEGGHNMRFFHLFASTRSKRNYVGAFHDGHSLLPDPELIKQSIGAALQNHCHMSIGLQLQV